MDPEDQNLAQDVNTQRTKEPRKKPQTTRGQKGQGSKPQSGKLRGLDKDSPEVKLSKTLSWLLRHGAQSERLPMREDGYVQVTDLVCKIIGGRIFSGRTNAQYFIS
jgi:2'-phosphotransferase